VAHNYVSLFSGIGGIDLGLDSAGWQCVAQVEKDAYCRRVLARHWPGVDRHDDVRTFPAWWGKQTRPDVDLVAAGFPCQPFSKFGLMKGVEDERWGWPWTLAAVRHLRPRYVLLENVAGLLRDTEAFSTILADLHVVGFDAQWSTVSACSVGAPHARERLFVVAYASGGDEPMQMPVPGGVSQGRSGIGATGGADGPFSGWLPEPEVGRVANGIPRRLVRRPLEALGNAVVPRVAELIGRMIIEGEK